MLLLGLFLFLFGVLTKPEIIRISGFLKVPSLLKVESTVCFQRKRGLPSSIKTKAGQSRVVVHWDFGCVLCALTTCLSAAIMRPSRRLRTAPGPLIGDYRTFVQLAFCVSVSFSLF